MKLTELEPYFLKRVDERTNHIVETLAEADGIGMICPQCFKSKGGTVGAHHILCWFYGKVPDTIDPKPGRWKAIGTGFSDLSFVEPVPKMATSVLLIGGCNAHFLIQNGQIILC